MKGNEPPSFQFYPGDFLASKAVVRMSPEARGGYIMLLCHAWPEGSLDDDDESLSQLSGLGVRWLECRDQIARAFVIRSGRWIQPRMVNEREAQRKRYEQAKKGASVTNAKRWT